MTSPVLFLSSHTFIRKYIRILVFQSGRFERAMEIHEQLVLGCFGGHAFVIVHHPLVASVHEVNLHTLHAPFRKLGKEFRMVFCTQPGEPKDYAHILFLAITDELVQVHIRIRSERIVSGLRPSFVQQDVFHTELGCEINVILVGVGIASTFKVYIRSVRSGTVPPFPCSEARLDPGRVFDLRRFGQTGGHGVLNELSVVFGNHEIAPWKTTLARCLGNVVGMFHQLQATVPVFSELNRTFRESRCNALIVRRSEEHVRIV